MGRSRTLARTLGRNSLWKGLLLSQSCSLLLCKTQTEVQCRELQSFAPARISTESRATIFAAQRQMAAPLTVEGETKPSGSNKCHRCCCCYCSSATWLHPQLGVPRAPYCTATTSMLLGLAKPGATRERLGISVNAFFRLFFTDRHDWRTV